MAEKVPPTRVLAQNRRARRDFEILDSWEAGLELLGTEVKSVRAGNVQLKDSFVEIRGGQAFLIKAHIAPYSHGNLQNHDPERPRRLLMHRRELDRLIGRVQGRGLTLVPLRMLTRGPWVKLEIGLARGKKLHDKRERERDREIQREMEQARRQTRW